MNSYSKSEEINDLDQSLMGEPEEILEKNSKNISKVPLKGKLNII